MKSRSLIPLTLTGLCCGLLTAGSFYSASFIVNGKRQTLDEAIAWQQQHYDISWYQPLEKTDYTIHSFDVYLLHVQFCKNPEPTDKYVIISHGYTDNRYGMLKYMRQYLSAGFHCIIYDLRGHGENAPDFCTYSIRESKDLHALIADTRRRYPDLKVLGLHGESLGAATTVAVLKYDQDLAFAVADCGFSEITNVLKVGMRHSKMPEWFVWPASAAANLRYGYAFTQMRPIDSLKNNQVPLLFLHGEKDTFIVPKNSEDMLQATAGPAELHVIPDAKHAASVLTHPDLYEEYLHAFLEKYA